MVDGRWSVGPSIHDMVDGRESILLQSLHHEQLGSRSSLAYTPHSPLVSPLRSPLVSPAPGVVGRAHAFGGSRDRPQGRDDPQDLRGERR